MAKAGLAIIHKPGNTMKDAGTVKVATPDTVTPTELGVGGDENPVDAKDGNMNIGALELVDHDR